MKLPRWLPFAFFALYGAGALRMALVDVFAGAYFASTTAWGLAPGWLREIAAFDVLVAYLCWRALRASPASELRSPLSAGLALLSFLIAANNANAFFASGIAAHIPNAAIHGLACAAGVAVAGAAPIAP